MVVTVLRWVDSPCISFSVIVPDVDGVQVMSTLCPAVKPAEVSRVKALFPAKTKAARAAKTIEVVNCMMTVLFSSQECLSVLVV